MIEFRGIAKSFGRVAALDAVDLTIVTGEFFSLLGPSGCGKTTLLRILAGFEDPTAGTVLLSGRDLAGVPPHRRPVNLMFQSYALFPHMSVERNIAFGLKMEGMGRSAIAARVGAMLALVQLEGLGKRMPHQISGGQRQRVALARALAKQPQVLLLDEPLSALDRKLRAETRLELVRIKRELGITFMLVTHDQEEALSLSDRIAVMNHGRIEQVGAPSDIYDRPASRYVAGFVGSINFLETEVIARDGACLHLAFAGVDILHESVSQARPGEPVCLALRPEEIALSTGASSNETSAENRLLGMLTNVAYLGERAMCSVDVDAGQTLQVSVSSGFASPAVKLGTAVLLTWPRRAGRLLP